MLRVTRLSVSGGSERHPTGYMRLGIILGDQLNRDSALFDVLTMGSDVVWMAEVADESTHVWSHKARIALFLSAMRHFRDDLLRDGWRVDYRTLGEPANTDTLGSELEAAIKRLKPSEICMVAPGDHRVLIALRKACPEIRIVDDRHFLSSGKDFAAHAEGRKQLRMEYFYREMRRRHNVLMDGKNPIGGAWNFDSENRESFGKKGPGLVPKPIEFRPDKITRDVFALIEERFAGHPGKLDEFAWPVTSAQARQALDDFIRNRLPLYGMFQDAMWTDEPFLFHARISTSLNLKLLDPRTAIRAAEDAYRENRAPLAAVEGFIRQILGWREYVRGIYWHFMPQYAEGNALDAHRKLPAFYWTGETEMNCLRQALRQTLDHGYAHHIQRLMVTGLYALLLGVEPKQVHEWYLAVYVDAVEWVELPNTMGMSQFADGGAMASKPYAASGKYIQRMSNYCVGCRYDPAESVGERACPVTTLYWDFLLRNEERLRRVPRMEMQLRNLIRIEPAKRAAIAAQADFLAGAGL